MGSVHGSFRRSTELDGLTLALGTFEISAIVFTACAAGVWLILRDSTDKIRSADLVVAAALLLLIILPTSFFVE
jgi:hypothetical protein